MTTMVRLWHEERADGTSNSALRIAIWVVVTLGVLGLVGPKIYSSMNHASTCQNIGTSETTSSFTTGTGTITGC